jgi:hypothetical protein
MKKFSVPCDFDGVKSPFTIYVGSVRADHHPLHFQADWLSKERGGTIPQEVMDSLSKLQELAKKNNTSFEDLCVYALGAAQEDGDEDAPSEPEANFDKGSDSTAIEEESPDESKEDIDDEESDDSIEKELEEDTEKSLEEELKELEEETNSTKNKDTDK